MLSGNVVGASGCGVTKAEFFEGNNQCIVFNAAGAVSVLNRTGVPIQKPLSSTTGEGVGRSSGDSCVNSALRFNAPQRLLMSEQLEAPFDSSLSLL